MEGVNLVSCKENFPKAFICELGNLLLMMFELISMVPSWLLWWIYPWSLQQSPDVGARGSAPYRKARCQTNTTIYVICVKLFSQISYVI